MKPNPEINMKTTIKALVLTLSTSLIATPSLASDLSSMVGVWQTDDADGRVEIYDCGDGTPCGRLTNITNADAKDQFNPDPSLRDRQLQGLVMLNKFKAKKSGGFKSGKIYNPRDGKSYKSAIKLSETGQLQVKACVAVFCQTQYWTRESTAVSEPVLPAN